MHSPAKIILVPATLLFALALCIAGAQSSTGDDAQTEASPATKCDLDLGQRVFGQCAICHSIEKDAPAIAGPNLHGVVGREAASGSDFKYSQALRASGKRWTVEELDRFLTDPMNEIPGTSMAFGGLKKPEQRAAVICYLEQASQ